MSQTSCEHGSVGRGRVSGKLVPEMHHGQVAALTRTEHLLGLRRWKIFIPRRAVHALWHLPIWLLFAGRRHFLCELRRGLVQPIDWGIVVCALPERALQQLNWPVRLPNVRRWKNEHSVQHRQVVKLHKARSLLSDLITPE